MRENLSEPIGKKHAIRLSPLLCVTAAGGSVQPTSNRLTPTSNITSANGPMTFKACDIVVDIR
jgi:hypothetical protein